MDSLICILGVALSGIVIVIFPSVPLSELMDSNGRLDPKFKPEIESLAPGRGLAF